MDVDTSLWSSGVLPMLLLLLMHCVCVVTGKADSSWFSPAPRYVVEYLRVSSSPPPPPPLLSSPPPPPPPSPTLPLLLLLGGCCLTRSVVVLIGMVVVMNRRRCSTVVLWWWWWWKGKGVGGGGGSRATAVPTRLAAHQRIYPSSRTDVKQGSVRSIELRQFM